MDDKLELCQVTGSLLTENSLRSTCMRLYVSVVGAIIDTSEMFYMQRRVGAEILFHQWRGIVPVLFFLSATRQIKEWMWKPISSSSGTNALRKGSKCSCDITALVIRMLVGNDGAKGAVSESGETGGEGVGS